MKEKDEMNLFTGNALIVEDDHQIANLLNIHLSELGLKVKVAHDAESALPLFKSNTFDICLLDWMLPGIQGIDLLKTIRRENSDVKILMLTAKVDPDSIVHALECGADDFLAKPFDAKVLLARARNLLRRVTFQKQYAVDTKNSAVSEISLDGLFLHFLKHIVQYENQDIHLTPSEFKLLESLIRAQGLVLTRDELISYIQGEEVNVTGRTIDTHIFALRKKLGAWSTHIETIRGVGYRILIANQDRTVRESDDQS